MCKKPTIRNNNNITTKKPNFTEAEDVALSKAYVSVTLDPIKGISQAKATSGERSRKCMIFSLQN